MAIRPDRACRAVHPDVAGLRMLRHVFHRREPPAGDSGCGQARNRSFAVNPALGPFNLDHPRPGIGKPRRRMRCRDRLFKRDDEYSRKVAHRSGFPPAILWTGYRARRKESNMAFLDRLQKVFFWLQTSFGQAGFGL